MAALLNYSGFNTPRRALNPMGMAAQNGAQNRYGDLSYLGYNPPTPDRSQSDPTRAWWHDQVYSESPWGRDDTTNKLLQLGFGPQAEWQRFIGSWAQPQFMESLKDAFGMVNPTAGAARVNVFRDAARNRAMQSGGAQAQELAALGFSPSAQAGVKTNALNQAEEAANEVWQQEMDPFQMLLKKLGLLAKTNDNPQQQMYAQLLGLSNQEKEKPGFLDTAAGLLGAFF